MITPGAGLSHILTVKFQWDHSGEHLFVQRRDLHFYPVVLRSEGGVESKSENHVNVLTPASLIQPLPS